MREIPYLKKAGEAVFHDRFHTRASELLKNWDTGFLNGEPWKGIGIIGAPLSKSSISHSGASLAPAAVRRALSFYSSYAVEENIDLKGYTIADFGDICMQVTDIPESHRRIETALLKVFAVNPGIIPIILGGDHSVSAPAIKAFAAGRKTTGVIQFDAHHDLRNLEDGGPTNGTPFRTLLESGVIKGRHLIQVGIRNFSNSPVYRDYAVQQGVSVLTMNQVRCSNIVELLKKHIEKIEKEVDAVYVSIDMDVLDQAFAPGCPAIGPGGMDSVTVLDAISYLGGLEIVKGMDIVEIDPTLDFRDMTSRVAAHIILNFLKEKSKSYRM